MRDAFREEFGQFASPAAAFPAFYAQDLIVFGLENDIVEAVRLGEKVMSENGYVLPLNLQKALKEYLVVNAEKYQRAVKKTGPIDNSTLYRKVKQGSDAGAAGIMSADDPYWQRMLDENSRRTQHWRVPSHLAWDHKPDGLVGEVLDMKKMRDNLAKMHKYL